ncbi:BadF/BadG/BcrA/BcrD ATPase family protein [Salipiger abyssi]|uniref:BadF/BadG/BcrA/BcrD ATPase family protein n=1 Tax=Salipiger abyssi TaxID=1250539 RepID=UPI001A8E8E05|nr:BadF/BadG/BcrA/BcrD ATPase family protein [Salipiger abyssi]MBN9890243.1 ATPase [Salipiger abyssi]
MILAADAGGSTCRLALERDGERIEVRLGAANVTSDFDGALRTLVSGLSELVKQAGLSLDALRPCPAYLALAGVTGPEIAARVAAALPLDQAVIAEDRRAAVLGALGEEKGCVAGIGTGSFLARQEGSVFATLGGHGLVLGDEASGAWLGRELLTYTLRAQDGLEAHSPLTETVLGEMGGGSGIVAFAAQATPETFGRLAPRIAAAQGDAAADMLMRRGAGYIATGLNALGWGPGEPLCLIGGVAGSYADWLPREMAQALRPAKGSALDGALALARRMAPAAPQGSA